MRRCGDRRRCWRREVGEFSCRDGGDDDAADDEEEIDAESAVVDESKVIVAQHLFSMPEVGEDDEEGR
jgi:hypothetical protein